MKMLNEPVEAEIMAIVQVDPGAVNLTIIRFGLLCHVLAGAPRGGCFAAMLSLWGCSGGCRECRGAVAIKSNICRYGVCLGKLTR